MSTENKLRGYILENFLFTDDESELDSNDSFLEKGIIDSTGIMEVIFFIKEEFGVEVEDDEMIPDNLDSVSKIIQFLERKQKAA